MYICVHVCTYSRIMCVRMYNIMFVCTYVQYCVFVYICIMSCMCVHIYNAMYVCTYYVQCCVFVYTYIMYNVCTCNVMHAIMNFMKPFNAHNHLYIIYDATDNKYIDGIKI